ncbi:MAG: hypothetical protein HQL37_06860 [Alphaproteobacteria bacterium]|nr:hypothetical protein [Alphaproteobacteria bacterium]
MRLSIVSDSGVTRKADLALLKAGTRFQGWLAKQIDLSQDWCEQHRTLGFV